MKERPILFTGEMVRAILDGRKTQTRRVGKCQDDTATKLAVEYAGHATKGLVAQCTYDAFPGKGTARWALSECPHGVPGERLWVKETHWRFGKWVKNGLTKSGRQAWKFRISPLHPSVCFEPPLVKPKRTIEGWHKRPSIFMPRNASRITLEIKTIRVERLHDISDSDAESEGIDFIRHYPDADETLTARKLYEILWESINGEASWKINPWVWVIEFKRIDLNLRSSAQSAVKAPRLSPSAPLR